MYRIGTDRFQIGPWGLRFAHDEIRLVSFLNETVNFPFVIFKVENDQTRALKIEIDKLETSGVKFTCEGHSGELRLMGDMTELEIPLQSPGGIMWPDLSHRTFFGEDIDEVDDRFSRAANYCWPSDDPTVIHLDAPVVTHCDPKSCFSILSQRPVKFHSFPHMHRVYCNAISEDGIHFLFKSHISRPEVLNFFRRSVAMPEIPHLHSMKQVLFAGNPIKETTDYDLEVVKRFQQECMRVGVETVVVGSLAMQLHGVKTPVNDIDILVRSKENLIKLAMHFHADVSNRSKWRAVAARIYFDGTCIDLNYVKGYEDDALDIEGVSTIAHPDLLFMKMLGEFERATMNDWYKTFRDKNYDAIMCLLKPDTFMYPFFYDFLQSYPTEQFFELARIVGDATSSEVSATINAPLQVNTFESEDKLVLPIINLGETQPARVTLNKEVSQATWKPLFDDADVQLSTCNSYSEIRISTVKEMGVLVCE